MKRCLIAAAAAVCSWSAMAQAPAAPKIAITSLVGDSVMVSSYRESSGSNLANASTFLKMPGPMLDLAVLKTAQDAVEKAAPGATVFALKVPVAGSDVDPAAVVVDGKVASPNVLVDALRQQGFTQLLTVTKLRNNNIVSLAGGRINTGRGPLEGLGFYIDPTARVQNTVSGELSEGIVAPFAYLQLRLVDLATMEVRTQTLTVNTVAAAAQNKTGADAWGSLTALEKINALEGLIKRNVAPAVATLYTPK